MRAVVAIAMVMGLGAATGVLADENAPLRAAQEELKIARGHLQDAGREYGGHRRSALEHVNQALVEIRLALRGVKTEPGDKHDGAETAD
jgi:hypothetical protein